ncbi:MAG TPA: non-homologous end-joining DNA ligase [Bryobacteraceae bacterium]
MTKEKLITHPEKIFWPDEGHTKLDVARFYEFVFPKLKPYLADRLLTMERCPDGMRGGCFYQKAAPKGFPSKAIQHENKETNYVVGGSLETQLGLVNLGCIPIHMWHSRAKNPRKPDWVVFDLDPGSGEFADAANAGLLLKRALDDRDFVSFPKTSGSRGLHVFIPLKVGPDCDDVLAFAQQICQRLTAANPETLTMEHRIEARKKRVYLDPFRNGFGQTVVAPYSIRRREKAPFSVPLSWPEVKPSLKPSNFNLSNYEKRLSGPDPWADFFKTRQPLK